MRVGNVMKLVGRETQRKELDRYCESPRPEFVVVYGRRRVGKTFLVREYFHNDFAFYATGVAGGRMADQLKSFNMSLERAGAPGTAGNWYEAFEQLRKLLERPDAHRDFRCGKLIVFIDEMPWFDTQRSGFLQALELFWNGWASAQPDILLIACGSATAWIVGNLLQNHGGLHNRVTGRILLDPFTLGECEEYYNTNGIVFSRHEMIESYMVFGGIPFYLDLLDSRLGLVQNIDRLCFSRGGNLRNEFDELCRSLFKHADLHIGVLRTLSSRLYGMSRDELIRGLGVSSGGTFSTVVDELELCGFLRRYRDFARKSRDEVYQIVDPFVLFWLQFVEGSTDERWWSANYGSARLRSWSGRAFEMVCLQHVPQIQRALGIWGISSDACAWRSKSPGQGAQIDLVIERADGVVNLCEMKFCDGPFAIDKAYDQVLRTKRAVFASETGTKKALHLTLVSPDGILPNMYRGTVQSVITGNDLFALA